MAAPNDPEASDREVDEIVARGPSGAWAVAGIATAIVARGPSGAFAVAGIATLIVVAIYFAFYFFIYLPRGAVQ